jgi:hypothetical protein
MISFLQKNPKDQSHQTTPQYPTDPQFWATSFQPKILQPTFLSYLSFGGREADY